MARHSRAQSGDMSFVIAVIVGAAAWTHWAQLVSIAYVFLGLVAGLLVLKLVWKVVVRRRFVRLRYVDGMDGVDFEHYIAQLLRKNGFHRVSLTQRYDFGVDIVAEKDGVRWGIQVKRYSGLVKAAAVRQVVTGLRIYDCERAMVITNSTFSAVAQRLAKANDCVLVDCNGLRRLTRRGCIL